MFSLWRSESVMEIRLGGLQLHEIELSTFYQKVVSKVEWEILSIGFINFLGERLVQLKRIVNPG